MYAIRSYYGIDLINAYVWMALASERGVKVAGENLAALKQELHPYLIADVV